MFRIAAASRPENAPAKDAAEKKSATLKMTQFLPLRFFSDLEGLHTSMITPSWYKNRKGTEQYPET